MYGVELKPGVIKWVDPSPELCVRLSNAVLCSHPEQAGGRVVLEICEYTEGEENPPLRIAVAVLSAENDNASLNVVINTPMGLLLSGKDCAGAVVHVTGVKFTPIEEAEFSEDGMPVPGYIGMDDVILGDIDDDDEEDEDYTIEGEESQDSDASDESQPLSTIKKPEQKSNKPAIEFKEAVSDDTGTQEGKPEEARPTVKTASRTSVSPSKKAKKTFPVIQHPSGLRYQDVIIGTGRRVVVGRNVALQYALRLENGKLVDKADRKRPFKFRLGIGECIKGIDLGVVGMREGGERHLIVPAELGYGDQNVANIPPGSTLYFDIVLIKAF